ncbi:hypothetical protein M413DRAFT_145198 [Hebeloma cylindrosporum]|uniref:F-box domain-containing protein n=1 Tax=Hebeloma cylindrosporum TaxID=76867 RepID=A0A0C3BXF2_HEBCY|nr:hypothetical protein M413DRAFT_145198 [Hebeloma cylindrosporum h7]
MAGFNDLPSEIIDLIFDELCGTFKSLWNDCSATNEEQGIFQTCLPVSTDFRHRILSRFCSCVSLAFGPDVTPLREVVSQPLNSRLGGIGRYTKHFYLEAYSRISDPESEILLDSQDLPVILDGLHGDYFGVKELSLHIYNYGDNMAWTDIPVDFRCALRSLLLSPRLTRLNIENVAFPSEIIFSGTHLKNLSIQRCQGVLAADSPSNKIDVVPSILLALPLPTLRELQTDHSHGCDLDLLPTPMLEKLEVYKELKSVGLHSAKTWRVIGLSASSLTEIYISHTGAVVSPPKNFNLGVVHNLRAFEYSRHSAHRHSFDSSGDPTPVILFHLFNVTEPMEYLKKIKINFDLRGRSINELFLRRTIADSNWVLLDGVLIGPYFLRLCHFEISVTMEATIEDPSDFRHRALSHATNDRFESSFSRIMAQESIVFLQEVKVLGPCWSSDDDA